ncbi:hypothetical protein BG015_009783 [Linnemannia schmuckeri]|uniref:Uncharacterized protein n=1 Tax=Linnemannia schmuckeri TaxID=64567 RepID=A0A9P5RV12_9FUNG|nr:hypothetical protein BG015_009783 [Linnemannia schmuckeri]
MTGTLDIIIANSDPEYTIKIPYKPHDPISVLFKRIHARLGTDEKSVYHQDLFLNGTPLEDHNRAIEHYCIVDQTTLAYHSLSFRSKTEGDVIMLVNVLYGDSYTLHFSPDTTIKDVKTMMHLLTGLDSSAQTLIFAGKKLENECTLAEYSIIDGSIIHLIRRLPGGTTAPHNIIFSDISDTSGLRLVHRPSTALPGGVTLPGTNIECACNCTTTHRVVCKKAFGTLELSRAMFVCPNCGESDGITPITVGFMRCKYRFRGIKASGEQYNSDWKDVKESDYYQLFDSNKEISWRRLDIETVSLDEWDECAICLDTLGEFDTLECSHRFHADCIRKWTGSCPTCRHERHLSREGSDGNDGSEEDSGDGVDPTPGTDGVGSLPADEAQVVNVELEQS